MDSYSFNKEVGEKIGQKLVSKMDVMSLSDVLYPYVSFKKIFKPLTKPSGTKILAINQLILF